MATTVINKRSGEPYDVYIGWPSRWCNPFSHLPKSKAEVRVATREEAVAAYAKWLSMKLLDEPEFLEPLRGKVLACWCRPAACHGDVIVELLGE